MQVPPIKEPQSGLNATVTISLGVFPRDAGNEAAAGVVGFQLPMTALYRQFMSIVTERVPLAGMNCSNDVVDCYLVDQNGYIVISEAHNHDAGKFFGSLDQTAPIMRTLVEQGLFQAVDIYDYLAVCYDVVSLTLLPFDFLREKCCALLMVLCPLYRKQLCG